MKKLPLIILAAGLMVACQSEDEAALSGSNLVTISPSITRATELAFESGDQIGLDIVLDDVATATNACMTYDGSVFSGEATWDIEGTSADLSAYYPYSADGLGSTFTVASDQSADGAYEASDLLTSTVTGVTPTLSSVAMTFKHRLTKLSVTLTNYTTDSVTAVTISGSIPTAAIASDLTATVGTGSAADIVAETVTEGTSYRAIVVPQTVALTLTVTTDVTSYTTTLASTELAAGYVYVIDAALGSEPEFTASISGAITDWTTGDEIGASEGSGDAGDDEGDDTEEDNSLYDETCVYANPAGTFYSSDLSLYATSAYYNADTDLLMTRLSSATAEASAHPTSTYASTWTRLLAADEFTPVSRGWSYAVDEAYTTVTSGYYPLQNPRNGWALQNTTSEMTWCTMPYATGSTSKFAYTTDAQEGQTSYLRIWSGYDSDASGIASASLHCCPNPSGTALSNWCEITSGTRVEIRARVRGNRQGFNEAIKLLCNTANDNGVNEYVTIMSNPASSASDTTSIVQGVNSGNTVTTTFDPYDWAIYWAEVYTDKVVLGINGKTTATIEYSGLPLGTGMRLVLSQGVGYNQSDTSVAVTDWMDASLQDISFVDSITSDVVPHMEVDWIRIWANADWAGSNYGHASTKFF